MRLLIGSMLALVLWGCASEPASKPESAPAVAAMAATAPSAAATTASAAPAAAAQPQTSKSFVGYKKSVTTDGRTVYCKKMAQTGSRFTNEVCITESEVEALIAEGKKDQEQFRRMQRNCGAAGCGGGT